MTSRNKFSRLVCLLLALIMLLSLCACGKETAVPQESEAPVESARPHQSFELSDTPVYKEESVYVNLNPDGSVSGLSVTDCLHTDIPQVRVEDVTNLKDISDVKTFTEPVYEKGRMYWDMESTELYYSGKTKAEPPISVSIKYSLDGKEISYDKLAGKSGRVTIDISVENNLKTTANIGGKSQAITCPMLFVGGMILPEEAFGSLETKNAAVLGDGSHKLVFFVGIPGMSESLALDSLPIKLMGDAITKSEYSVTAEVESFSISNMMFAAVPFSSVFAMGGEGALDGVEDIKAVLSDIEGLLDSFANLDINQLMQMLYGGASQAEKLISAVGEAQAIYEENKELLALMDRYVTDENLALMERIISELNTLDTSAMSSIFTSSEFTRLMNLLGRFDENIRNLANLSGDARQLMNVIDSLRSELSDAKLKKSVDNLPQTVSRLRSLVNVMKDSQDTLDSFEELLNGDTMASIMSITEKYANLSSLSQAQAEHLGLRMKEWLSFGQAYDIFTKRTSSATSSVIFIYKTEAIG